jgi:uncharacterized delta-60 repeat protein
MEKLIMIFNSGTGANNNVRSIAIQADGKIIIGGAFNSYNGTSVSRIVRLNTDGSIDTTFNTGTGANNQVYIVSIQNDGKILVGGTFTTFNGVSSNYLVRLNIDGSTDNTFNQGTGFDQGAFYGVKSISIQPDGKIIVGGGFVSYNGTPRSCIIRLNNNGSIDSSFNPGTGADNHINTISIQTDGKIIIGGIFNTYNSVTKSGIARLNSNGSLDLTFNSGTGVYGIISTAIQTDGKIIMGGDFTSYNGTTSNRIARINPDGSIDTTFNSGAGSNNIINSIKIQLDGKIIIGGLFKFYNNTSKNHITRINIDGSLDTTFNYGSGANNEIWSTKVQQDGKILVGGSFTSYNGKTNNRLVRLNSDGSIDNSFNSGTGIGVASNIEVSTIAIQTDEKIIIGGSFTIYNGTIINGIARLNTDGSLDTTFQVGSGAFGRVLRIEIQSDGKIIIAGDFIQYNGVATNRIARINPDGSLDITFSSGLGANATIWSTSIQQDGKIIIAGTFTSYNGVATNRIARINSDGSLDTTFNSGTGANNFVYATGIQTDGKIIIGGWFTSYNGSTANRIARLNSDGSIDTTFNSGSGTDSDIRSITILTDGKIIIAGSFISYNGFSAGSITRLNSDGSIDIAFDSSIGTSQGIRSVTLQSDGKIIIAGAFNSYNGIGRNRISRIFNSSITGVNDSKLQFSKMDVYPNPTGSQLNLILNETEPLTIEIYSLEGKLIIRTNVTQNMSFNVSNYPKGMYFITATNKTGKIYQSKFVKE